MARTGADDVHDEAVDLAWIPPQPAADHLAVERAALGRPRHNDAGHRWLIEAFDKDATVGHYLRLAALESSQDGPPFLEWCLAVDLFRPNAGLHERGRHELRQLHARGEDNGLPVPRVLLVGLHQA